MEENLASFVHENLLKLWEIWMDCQEKNIFSNPGSQVEQGAGPVLKCI